MNKLKIGIIGCGAIGSSLAKIIINEFSDKAQLTIIYDLDLGKVKSLTDKLGKHIPVAPGVGDLIKKVDLVIEATKPDAVYDIAKKVITASKDIIIMSVGGIIESYKELEKLAYDNNARLFIPSGAVCGIDGLKAAGCGKINKVILTTTKPPSAFLGTPFALENKMDLKDLKEDIVIFEGDVFSAIILFPQNINVAATLAIAGIGPEKTVVRIVASPRAKRNMHEIEIESDSGKILTRTENVIHPDNPKTSYLAVLSATATLKQILKPIKVGT
ncbi:MAG: hypothetical protein A2166_03475 [Omnitrophica WOR_2 bacterium RBG_13_41_10]|nr:MAG: hypothetical protein A2166_03475 [Omnitrophica WOR_2 bacterium RBG_13_41_10]